jgi:hypothetical protein
LGDTHRANFLKNINRKILGKVLFVVSASPCWDARDAKESLWLGIDVKLIKQIIHAVLLEEATGWKRNRFGHSSHGRGSRLAAVCARSWRHE